jgi:hypothetical protein
MRDLTEQADELIRNRLYNHAELAEFGLSRNHIFRLVSDGVLKNPVSGIFHHSERDFHELDPLALIAKRYPDAVFNLYTAAKHWDMSQIETDYIWVSVPYSRKKKITMGDSFELPIRTLLSDRPFDMTVGVEDVDILGQAVKMTSPARTIVDMWRMSTVAGDRHPGRIIIRDENLFQSLAAYLEQNNGKSAELATTALALELGERTTTRFFEFAKTYASGFEAQRTL